MTLEKSPSCWLLLPLSPSSVPWSVGGPWVEVTEGYEQQYGVYRESLVHGPGAVTTLSGARECWQQCPAFLPGDKTQRPRDTWSTTLYSLFCSV